MTDIVERLHQSVTKGHEPTDDLAIEAADEIERLRIDNKRMHTALIKAAELVTDDYRHR